MGCECVVDLPSKLSMDLFVISEEARLKGKLLFAAAIVLTHDDSLHRTSS